MRLDLPADDFPDHDLRADDLRYDDLMDEEWTVRNALGEAMGSIGGFIARNPSFAGATTALAVAATFFSANALLFQEGQHPSAFFATRPIVSDVQPKSDASGLPVSADEPNVTRFVLNSGSEPTHTASIEPSAVPIPVPAPRPHEATNAAEKVSVSIPYEPSTPASVADGGEEAVLHIQELLAKLGYYEGDLDGLDGPMTRSAIEDYKKHTGLKGIELTDAELMTSMRNNLDVTAAVPKAPPAPSEVVAKPQVKEVAAAPMSVEDLLGGQLPKEIPSADVVKVQAALKAFGNTDVAVDGIAGGQTEEAIREFQTLFRLPVTGEIDEPLLEKMRDVGLVQ